MENAEETLSEKRISYQIQKRKKLRIQFVKKEKNLSLNINLLSVNKEKFMRVIRL